MHVPYGALVLLVLLTSCALLLAWSLSLRSQYFHFLECPYLPRASRVPLKLYGVPIHPRAVSNKSVFVYFPFPPERGLNRASLLQTSAAQTQSATLPQSPPPLAHTPILQPSPPLPLLSVAATPLPARILERAEAVSIHLRARLPMPYPHTPPFTRPPRNAQVCPFPRSPPRHPAAPHASQLASHRCHPREVQTEVFFCQTLPGLSSSTSMCSPPTCVALAAPPQHPFNCSAKQTYTRAAFPRRPALPQPPPHRGGCNSAPLSSSTRCPPPHPIP